MNIQISKTIVGFFAATIFVLGIIFFVLYTIWIPKSKVMVTPQVAKPKPPLTLEVLNPQDGSIVSMAQATVSGTTLPDTVVSITGTNDDTILEPNADGTFSAMLALAEGENEFNITVIDPSGNEQTVQRNIVYTTDTIE